MPNKRKCRHCSTYGQPDAMLLVPLGAFCNAECAAKYGLENKQRGYERKRKAERKELKQAKERVMRLSDWYDKLQALINQYVVHVRDKDEPCCTCGTSSQNVKFDAGHCFTRGARAELRFELTNIHKQCSSYCNVWNSGKQAEHKEFIAKKYGAEHLVKLEDRTQWRPLKEQFPTIDSIKSEIDRYRKMIRDNGLKPRR